MCFLFRGPVYDVAVHPSGKVALSVGRDKTMRFVGKVMVMILFGVFKGHGICLLVNVLI